MKTEYDRTREIPKRTLKGETVTTYTRRYVLRGLEDIPEITDALRMLMVKRLVQVGEENLGFKTPPTIQFYYDYHRSRMLCRITMQLWSKK